MNGRVDRLLAALRAAGDGGVCLSDLPARDGYTARNAVASARAAGHTILGERCRVHPHRGSVARYTLKGGDAHQAVAGDPSHTTQPPAHPVTASGAELFAYPVIHGHGGAPLV